MELCRGRVVISKAGHDKGLALVVLAAEPGAVLVCNGKTRPLERPKQKNPLHLAPTKACIAEESMATNREIRSALRELFPTAVTHEEESFCRNKT